MGKKQLDIQKISKSVSTLLKWRSLCLEVLFHKTGPLLFGKMLLCFLRQTLFSLTSNESSCLSLLRAGVIGVYVPVGSAVERWLFDCCQPKHLTILLISRNGNFATISFSYCHGDSVGFSHPFVYFKNYLTQPFFYQWIIEMLLVFMRKTKHTLTLCDALYCSAHPLFAWGNFHWSGGSLSEFNPQSPFLVGADTGQHAPP